MFNNKIVFWLGGIIFYGFSCSYALAQQPNPNEDRFIQPPPQPLPATPQETEPILPKPQPQPTTPIPNQQQVKIPVREVKIVGNTVFDAELNLIIQPLTGRTVTLDQLLAATNSITKLYQDKGYLTSRAILPKQQITDAVVTIQIIEGSLEDIKIEGTKKLNPAYIRSRIKLGAFAPLQVEQLEDQLRLLKTDPLFKNLSASLQAGSKTGTSILVVRVEEANPFYGNLSFDNYSPPSVGSQRLGATLGYRNVTGLGDNFSGSYYRSTTGGLNLYDFNYRLPVNAKDGSLKLRSVISNTKVTQDDLEEFNIEGDSQFYEISFRQPLIRTPREEFALSLGFSYRDGQTFIFDRIATPFGAGAEENGVTRTSVFRLGQDYLKRDPKGIFSARSQFSIGTGLFDATINQNPVPDSRFVSWLGQIQRVVRLSKNQLLIVQGDLQLTPDSLLPSEQFIIGGGQFLRGYRQNARSGDNGFRLLVEDRITLASNEAGISKLAVAPFFDMGAVWNHPDNPNEQQNQTFLASLGLGLLWEPIPNLNLRVDYAYPFIDLNDRGNNLQDNGVYFNLNYKF
ncbi:MAG: ShlB/FhaC/HecB family hemolysin secretion/activation protein [Rivularia sp. (in: cyanobacteria)]